MDERVPPEALAAQAAERGFVRCFGGYTVGWSGGTLVVNERIPVPRFNFVQIVRVAPERLTAFFEVALDHYFQRALRPTFRVAEPVPPATERALEDMGFRAPPEPELWLVAGPDRPERSRTLPPPELVPDDRLDDLVDLWIGPQGREEFRRHLEVARVHPNPGERIEPRWTLGPDGALRSAGLAYRRGGTLLVEGISTPEPRRGHGSATEWMIGLLGAPIAREARRVALRTSTARLARRLAPLGFRPALRSRVYELPAGTQLALPNAKASAGPLWRPPRIA